MPDPDKEVADFIDAERERLRKYRQKNREHVRVMAAKYQLKYKAENKEKILFFQRKYHARNRQKEIIRARKRRVEKLLTTAFLATAQMADKLQLITEKESHD